MTNEALFVLFRNLTILFATILLVKYFVFLILASWFMVRTNYTRYRLLRREVKRHGHIPPYTPLVSVVIPAWNEEVGILATLRSVLENTYERVEIIVVNDGSTDRSKELIDAFIDERRLTHPKHPHSMKQYYVPNGGKGKALNIGVKKSHGEIVLTMDADSALEKDAIANLVEYFRDDRVAAVVGQVRVANVRGRLIGRMQQLEYLFGFYFKRAHCALGAEYIYGGACTAFRRSATFDTLGLFDEKNKTEDIEMSMRTKYYGLKSIYAEDVICYTEGASTYAGLINQRLRWKKGRFDTFVRYRRMFFSWTKHHNPFLSWFVLPLALLAELQLVLEPIGVTLLVTYSLISGEFVSLALSMLFVGISYLVIALFGNHLRFRERLGLLALWPFTWPLFYMIVWIEFHALTRSLHMGIRGDELQWQKWQREGIDT